MIWRKAGHVRSPTGSRRGVDTDPAVAAQVGLDPGMGAIVSHGNGLAQAVPFATQKPIHVARGHATQAQQNGGGRGEVLAVTGRLVKQEIFQWVGDAGVALEVGGVGVCGLQPFGHSIDLGRGVGLVTCQTQGQLPHPR